MPRTTIILQTRNEPTKAELEAILQATIEAADEQGVRSLKAHGIAPTPSGGSLQLTVTKHERTSTTRETSS